MKVLSADKTGKKTKVPEFKEGDFVRYGKDFGKILFQKRNGNWVVSFTRRETDYKGIPAEELEHQRPEKPTKIGFGGNTTVKAISTW